MIAVKEAHQIIEELNELKSPLGAASHVLPFAVPEGYFEGLAEVLAAGALAAEAEDPLLQLPKSHPFAVPDGYFEHASEAFLEKAKALDEKAQKKGIIIPLWRRTTRSIRLAAAAMLLFAAGFGGYRYFAAHTPDARASRQLARLDTDTLSNYLVQHIDELDDESLENAVAISGADVHAAVSQLDAAEIEDYLNEAGEALPPADRKNLN